MSLENGIRCWLVLLGAYICVENEDLSRVMDARPRSWKKDNFDHTNYGFQQVQLF